jgi:hypothetical protein
VTVDDPYLPLAFSLANSPGAYAVLAGAGVSKGAGLPSAWDIEVDLVRQIARRDGATVVIDNDTAEQWYFDNYGKQLTYSSVIEDVAPKPHERQALLQKYFESAADEDQASVPIPPSAAHRAVARLVEAGIIRVIVTPNFDRLFELALIERGIQPTIVATEAEAKGLGPLHLVQACVIHLHGDYLNPTSMRNTAAELNGYRPNMRRLLRHVLGDYGLIVAGWSVQHDTALREATTACCTRRFTMGWISPGHITDAARNLINTYSAVIFETNADEAFGHLADQVTAIRAKRGRHPLTVTVAASRIKRHLTGQSPAISAHDMVAEELQRLRELPEFALDNYNNPDPNYAQELTDRVIEAARIPAAAVAVLTFWGDPVIDKWWTPHLERLARVPRYSGTAWLGNLPLIAALMLYYAAGVAAVCAENYARLVNVFALHGEPIDKAGLVPLSQMLRYNTTMMKLTAAQHHQALCPTLAEALALGSDVLDDAWQLFEILRLAAQLMQIDRFGEAAASYASADARRIATADVDPTAGPKAEAAKSDILDGLAAGCHPRGLYLCAVEKVYSSGTSFRWASPMAERLAEEVHRERELHPLVSGLNASPQQIELALRAVSHAIGEAGNSHPTNRPNASGFMPEEVWIDT